MRERDIFIEALQQSDPARRAVHLDDACQGDASLRSQIERLLAEHERQESFILDAPPAGFDGTALYHPIAERPGTIIGPYKLLQQIGEGGMGVVFMAEQTEPFQRTVALKIIKPGMDTRQVIARFEAERQALAMMDHPNIAKVLDAGTTDTGRPYFVMELVKGVPITQYCDEKRLPLRARLELLVPVCQAVQHAHQKGVIHRDIKPTNVLVAEYDDQAVPKVIDFGVAKATAQKLTDRTMFTEFGQVLGTVEYMSPEQAKLNQLDIDTRSDIYSLGVLLYELLTGSTPFGRKRLQSAAFDEMLRIIREEEPPKPSTRLSTTAELASIAASRGLEPKKLSGLVQGELDWMVMKALEKDRNRRYETANGMAQDIERYLTDQPVEARRPTRTYRLRKFIRRNKVGALAGSAIALALALGTVVSTWQALRADREAKIARIQAARSEQVALFLKDMLKGVAPSVALGRDTTMLREIVDRTADRVDRDLKDQPEVQIELYLTLGQVYFQLQLYKQMELNARHTLEAARARFGEEHVTVADALGQLGYALMSLRAVDEGETVARQAIAMQRRLRGENSLEEADSLCNLADNLRHTAALGGDAKQQLAEAESAARAGLAIRRKRLGNGNDETAWALHGLAIVLLAEGKIAEAEAAMREAHAMRVRIHGDEHPFTAADLHQLGDIIFNSGKFEEAERCHRNALTIQEKMDGKGKLSQARTHSALGQVLRERGKLEEAETHFREAVAIGTKEVGAEFPDLPGLLADLARVLAEQGKLTEARQRAEQAVDICQRHPDQVERRQQERAFGALRNVLIDLNDAAALEVLAKQLIDRAELAGNADQLAGAYAEAIPMLMSCNRLGQAKDLCRKLLALTPQNGQPAYRAAWFLATAENPAHRNPILAVELAKKAVEFSPQSAGFLIALGVARYRAGEFKQAVADLEKSTQLRKEGSSEEFFLAMAHWQLDHKDEARKWYDKAVEWMDTNHPQSEELRRFRTEADEIMKNETGLSDQQVEKMEKPE